MAQLQFICVGAMSLVVGNLVAQSYADQDRFFRHLERVPLLPGRSVLCHRMCPDLIRQRRDLQRHNSWEALISASSSSSSHPRPPQTPYIPDYTPEDLMRDPETQDLESIVRLLRNCQARMEYERELLGAQSPADEAADDIATVPPPGVPVFGIENGSD
jgi:hypothetical protein